MISEFLLYKSQPSMSLCGCVWLNIHHRQHIKIPSSPSKNRHTKSRQYNNYAFPLVQSHKPSLIWLNTYCVMSTIIIGIKQYSGRGLQPSSAAIPWLFATWPCLNTCCTSLSYVVNISCLLNHIDAFVHLWTGSLVTCNQLVTNSSSSTYHSCVVFTSTNTTKRFHL